MNKRERNMESGIAMDEESFPGVNFDEMTDEEIEEFLLSEMCAENVDPSAEAHLEYLGEKGKHVERITSKRKYKKYRHGVPGKTGVKTPACVRTHMMRTDLETYLKLRRENAFTPPAELRKDDRKARIENQSAKKNIGRTARRNSVRETQDVLADFMCDAALEPAGNC